MRHLSFNDHCGHTVVRKNQTAPDRTEPLTIGLLVWMQCAEQLPHK